MESMNLSPKGGPKLRDEVVSMNPQKRHLQTTKGTGVAVHQGVHLTVDSHDSLMEPGEDVTEEIKEQHGRGKERGRKENQVPVRIHKVPPLERTEIQCIKPGNSKGKKLQQEAHIYTCTPLTYTHMHTHAHPSHTHVHTHTCVLSYTHKRAHGHTCTHTHIHSHKCICSHTHTNNLPTYTHSHVHPPTHTHTHTHIGRTSGLMMWSLRWWMESLCQRDHMLNLLMCHWSPEVMRGTYILYTCMTLASNSLVT